MELEVIKELGIGREVAKMAISHPKFGYRTGALEAARAFGDEIRGKVGGLFGFLDLIIVCCVEFCVVRCCGVILG